MKLHIEKFLALTAMIATAQVGASACTAVDDADDTEQGVDEDDEDAGGQSGSTDDDADDEVEGDDDVTSDAGGEGGSEDDDVVDVDEDAGPSDEGGDVDGGLLPADDAGAEGGDFDGGLVVGDAGSEGVLVGDAGTEGVAMGDAGLEGATECLGGSFDPAIEAVDCEMFDACLDDPYYYGSAQTQCWQMVSYRRGAVYESFIGCVNAAELADPCGEAADIAVSECAWEADMAACPDDDSCALMAESCGEIDMVDCQVRLAPWASTERYEITTCFDYAYGANAETLGPSYEGCGYDFENCMALLGPGGE